MSVAPAARKQFHPRYQLGELIGEGGMGQVYRALDSELQRPVAVKTLQNVHDTSSLELFKKECAALATLNHPNIIDIYDVGQMLQEGRSRPFFVMPLLEGETLDRLIRRSGPLPVQRCVEIILHTCRGLQAAHEKGVVHRDLKPSNIFVLLGDSVKIIDFGVACMIDRQTTIGLKGTLYYMAPELLELKPPSRLSDIFALGVVCYEALSGRRPFEGSTDVSIQLAILKEIPPPVSEFNPKVNRAMSQVIHKAMAKKPWLRFQSAREFGEALQKAYRDEPIEIFDDAKTRIRLQRARKSVEEGNLEFARELLDELESDCVDPEVGVLRRQVDKGLLLRRINELLSNARLRYEEEEYQLAIVKVQEVLELDPENAEALALKASIEEQSSAKQIEAWRRLARQHMESNLFSHARDALRNVLQLKPKDTETLRLQAEIDDREAQFHQLREERQHLFDAALEAKERGDISGALSKIQRLVDLVNAAPEWVSSGHSAEYQRLYKEIRSEHEDIKNAYDQARSHLEFGQDLDAALAICEQYLERYPADARFQALKFEVQERQRQKLSAYIAQVHQEAEAEPNLDRKVEILRRAQAQHPDEPHFERSLRIAIEKRDLVDSIVSKARNFEAQEQFAEALSQWEMLNTIYSRYPGLEYEIDRVKKRRELQNQQAARLRWVEQIERYLGFKDFKAALGVCERALREFPDDGELLALQKQATQGATRKQRADELLTTSRDLLTQGRESEALATLQEGYQLDDQNVDLRDALVQVLLDQARARLESDWRGAEDLLKQALEIDPGSALGRSLETIVADRRKTEFVNTCLARSREHEAAGDIPSAMAVLEKGLSTYPDDRQLVRLHTNLRQMLPPESPPAEASTAGVANPAPEAAKETAEVAAKPSPPAKAPRPKREGGAAFQKSIQWLRAPALPGKVALPRWALAAGGMAVAAVAAIAIAFWPESAPRTPGSVAITLASTPEGAVFEIGGRVVGPEVSLAPGRYEVRATLAGYYPASQPVDVQTAGQRFVIPLRPLEPLVQLLGAGLDKGTVQIDGQPAGELSDGQFVTSSLPPGQHQLKLSGSGFGEVVLAFELGVAQAPALQGPVQAKELKTVVVTAFRDRGRLYSSLGTLQARLNGEDKGVLSAEGLDLGPLPAGTHQLSLFDGRNEVMALPVEITGGPQLLISLSADRNVGNLLVQTGVPDVEVFVNDRKQSRRTNSRGDLQLLNLEPGQVTVRVAKAGFAVQPGEQAVTVVKSQWRKVEFLLKELPPEPARLELSGLAPQTEVVLDGKAAGRAQAGGSFSSGSISPGRHTIELRRAGYRNKTIEVQFEAGRTHTFVGNDTKQELETGTVQFSGVEPRNATLVIQADPKLIPSGQLPAQREYSPVPSSLQLPVGKYNFIFRAPEHDDFPALVELVDREVKSLPMFRLAPAAKVAKVETPKPGSMNEWQSQWKLEEGWYVHRGGGDVLYGRTPSAGVFSFTFKPPSGGTFKKDDPPVRVIVGYQNNRDHALLMIDRKDYTRSRVLGAEKRTSRNPHKLDPSKEYECRVTVSEDKVQVRIHSGPQSMTLDEWTIGAADKFNPVLGKFGFRIEQGEEMRMKDFSFRPETH